MTRSIRVTQISPMRTSPRCSQPGRICWPSIPMSDRRNMSALAEARITPHEIAADIDAALASPDWRSHVSWPVSLAEANRIGREQARAALRSVAGIDDDLLRDSALLALPVILSYARAIVLAAAAVSRAARNGAKLVGRAPELIYLQGGQGPLPARTEPVLA